MSNLRQVMDQEADLLVPSPDPYAGMLARVRRRERRRRLLAGVVAMSTVAGGGLALWVAFHSGQVRAPQPPRPVTSNASQPSYPPLRLPANGPILFAAHGQDRRVTIFRVEADGSGLSRVDGDYAEAYTASGQISPDGSLLAYGGTGGIRVMSMDGTGDRLVVPAVPAPPGYTTGREIDGWSPDGTHLLFEESNDIHSVDVAGGQVTALTHSPVLIQILIDGFGKEIVRPSEAEETDAAWSPDGGTIAFVRGGALFVMPPDGSDAHVLAEISDRVIQNPRWAPDGSALAFTTLQIAGTYPVGCGYGGGVFVVGADGAGLQQLTGSACDRELSWSPSSDRLLFSTADGLVVIRPDGSGRKLIAEQAELATWSPDGEFVAYLGGNPEFLYVSNADGTGARRVPTPDLFVEQSPVLWTPAAPATVTTAPAPSNGRIAFIRTRAGSEGDGRTADLLTANPDGTDVSRMASATTASAPAWSPDGTRIAFDATADGVPGLFVMDADGSDLHRVTTCDQDEACSGEGSPSWSPDGTRLAFWSDREGQEGLWLVEVNDGSLSLLAGGVSIGPPSWSPDGRLIAAAGNRVASPEKREIVLVDAESGAITMEITPDGLAPSFGAAWSPDGAWLAFDAVGPGGGDEGAGIYLVRPDGSDLRLLTACPIARCGPLAPAWSPDGRMLAFVAAGVGDDPSGLSGPLFVVAVETGTVEQITDGADCCPSWQPMGGR
jgi:Tol biopolymer transport system component